MSLSLVQGPWRTPLLVVLVAFSAGAQLPFLLQALGGQDYWRDDVLLKLLTILTFFGGLYLLLPRPGGATRPAGPLEPAMPEAEAPPPPRAAPPPPAPAALPAPAPPRPAARPPPPGIRLSLDSPLARGPVWPPGEPLPLTLQVRGVGPGDLDGLDLELELRHAGGQERARFAVREPTLVLSQTVPTPGDFAIRARASWHGQPIGDTLLEGRAAPYREEIGRRFEALKASCAQQGLGVGQGSTPRELQRALERRFPQMRRSLQDLVAALEEALYGEEETQRDTYEALERAIAELEQHGLEAAPRA